MDRRCGWTKHPKNCENARVADYQLAIERQKQEQEKKFTTKKWERGK
ncbi:hypothetical protein [Bartonella sp. B30(2025)]